MNGNEGKAEQTSHENLAAPHAESAGFAAVLFSGSTGFDGSAGGTRKERGRCERRVSGFRSPGPVASLVSRTFGIPYPLALGEPEAGSRIRPGRIADPVKYRTKNRACYLRLSVLRSWKAGCPICCAI